MDIALSQHAKERLNERFDIKANQDSIRIDNLTHLHNDKYLYCGTILVIRNNKLLTIYPRG